eukprot:5248143-Pleurochrysis_carterae.AAC.1
MATPSRNQRKAQIINGCRVAHISACWVRVLVPHSQGNILFSENGKHMRYRNDDELQDEASDITNHEIVISTCRRLLGNFVPAILSCRRTSTRARRLEIFWNYDW